MVGAIYRMVARQMLIAHHSGEGQAHRACALSIEYVVHCARWVCVHVWRNESSVVGLLRLLTMELPIC